MPMGGVGGGGGGVGSSWSLAGTSSAWKKGGGGTGSSTLFIYYTSSLGRSVFPGRFLQLEICPISRYGRTLGGPDEE